MLPGGVKGRVGVARGRREEWGVIAWQVNGCVAVTTEASALYTICTVQAFIKVYAACTSSQASALTHAAHLPLPLCGESLDIGHELVCRVRI